VLRLHAGTAAVDPQIRAEGLDPQFADVVVGVVAPLGECDADGVECPVEPEAVGLRAARPVEAAEAFAELAGERERAALGNVGRRPTPYELLLH